MTPAQARAALTIAGWVRAHSATISDALTAAAEESEAFAVDDTLPNEDRAAHTARAQNCRAALANRPGAR